ncbi:MAG TPA: cytidylate kinase-like family protein [Candidatus Bathyarchaeia archaeon]|nr:cytidylate kinase-like family protein [Candidatus Bathyarchaeia archaeon]
MVRLITISREFGSGGSEVARILAERLEWKLIDDPLVAEIARRANVSTELARRYDECVDPWFHRMFKALWQGGYEGVVSHGELNAFDADAMAGLWTRVIRESAQLGHCVIVGRGAQCLLEGRTDVFHVSVFAEMDERVRNLRGPLRRHVPAGADPRTMAEESDLRRSEYVRRYFGADWKDYRLYNIVINSAVGFEAAATAILLAAGLATRQVVKPSA